MKKLFLICLLAIVTCFLAAPPLQAASTLSSKPGVSKVSAKNKHKKKHPKGKIKKHKKQKSAV